MAIGNVPNSGPMAGKPEVAWVVGPIGNDKS
jgi:hypothetical protein